MRMEATKNEPLPQLALSVEQFCREANIGRSLFFQLLAEGRGPRVKRIGRKLLVPRREAERWIESLPERDGSGPEAA